MNKIQDTQFMIGQLIDSTMMKDAVHIAVVPVIAQERLSPGQPIGMEVVEGEFWAIAGEITIGIVDPFLPGPVFEGDVFWMFLNPNTITGLRHTWTHPAFDDMDVEGNSDEIHMSKAEYSEQWLRDFAARWCMDFDDMMDTLAYGGTICAGVDIYDWGDIGREEEKRLWDHFSIVTNPKNDPSRIRDDITFSCAC